MTGLIETLRFSKSFLSLIHDPTRTEEVFEIAELGMRSKDRAPIEMTERVALADPQFSQMMKLPPAPLRPCLDAFAQLPDGTVGREFARHMRTNGLSVDFFPTVEGDQPIHFISQRAREVHDLWHVLTGYGTSVRGEAALQAFTLSQLHSSLSGSIVVAAVLHTLKNNPQELLPLMDGISDGYRLGKATPFLLGVRWEDRWEAPLERVREELGIRANAEPKNP